MLVACSAFKSCSWYLPCVHNCSLSLSLSFFLPHIVFFSLSLSLSLSLSFSLSVFLSFSLSLSLSLSPSFSLSVFLYLFLSLSLSLSLSFSLSLSLSLSRSPSLTLSLSLSQCRNAYNYVCIYIYMYMCVALLCFPTRVADRSGGDCSTVWWMWTSKRSNYTVSQLQHASLPSHERPSRFMSEMRLLGKAFQKNTFRPIRKALASGFLYIVAKRVRGQVYIYIYTFIYRGRVSRLTMYSSLRKLADAIGSCLHNVLFKNANDIMLNVFGLWLFT